MAHCNTILSQILKLVPRDEFETLAKHHHSGRNFRKASRRSKFVSLTMAQLSGRNKNCKDTRSILTSLTAALRLITMHSYRKGISYDYFPCSSNIPCRYTLTPHYAAMCASLLFIRHQQANGAML
jgi:hypothetical protein